MSDRRIRILFVVVVALFAVLGPFGTRESMSLGTRALFWTLIHGTCWFFAIAVHAFIDQIPLISRQPLVLRTVIIALAANLPITLSVEVIGLIFVPHPFNPIDLVTLYEACLPITAILATAGSLTMVGQSRSAAALAAAAPAVPAAPWMVPDNASSHATSPGTRPPEAHHEAPTAAGTSPPASDPSAPAAPGSDEPDADPRTEARLFARMPARLGRNILYLAMQDHYAEIVTDQGSALVLMRMADAVAELDGIRGMRIHRSYWVACSAVVGLAREGDRLLVEVKDGRRLPVSRANIQAAREAFSDRTQTADRPPMD